MDAFKACEHAEPGAGMCDKCHIKTLQDIVFEDRNQRRYEIARDVMASLARTDGFHSEAMAQQAVRYADALLAELERNDGVS